MERMLADFFFKFYIIVLGSRPYQGLAYIQQHRCALFLVINGLDDGVSYTVTLLDCGVGWTKTKLVVGYLVVGCEVRINSGADQIF